jgi:hypothetical protein
MVARKDGKIRIGKGFSKSELKEAGVDFKQALRFTIPIDLRRKTRHAENVNVLRQQLGLQMPKISKPPEPVKKPAERAKKPAKPMKEEVAEAKKPTKPTKQKKTTEISKPPKSAKTIKTEKPAPKKPAVKRKTVKPKGAEKT